MDELRVSEVAKALASPVRVRILKILEGGERCGCELVPLLELDPSVVSRHLAILSRAGLVESRREGVRIMWRLASPEIPRLLHCIESLACEKQVSR
ncbi:winged helix-turn-helix transcriptional regulator [Candidatus Bipolaricaulota bacterium]|nr:winged helix-turn-helix transcriptional regulator [Candidatus Bipolaricaulota bacterium]MCW7077390.1 metalloregulator ArsR/SmtB family transcription factor [Candidatus Syntrophoarchaeum sp.]